MSKAPKHSKAAIAAYPAPVRSAILKGADYAKACMEVHEARIAFDKPKPAHPLMMNEQSWNKALVMDIVCERISTSTRSIATILKEPHNGYGLPDYTTFKRWLVKDEDLCTQYARAKEDQADFMAEEMLEIADDGSNDWMERHGKDGENLGYQVNGEHVQRSRLRLDTRKWLASKLKPKKYGDKTTIAGDAENPLAVLTMEQITLNPASRIKVT